MSRLKRMRRPVVLMLVGVVLGAVVPAAWAAAKLSKTQIPSVSAYCSTIQDPQASYGPCLTAGKSVVTVDPATGNGQFTSVAVGADGIPVVSYVDANLGGTLKVAKCSDIACTRKRTITTVAGSEGLNAYTSIAIGTDGNPIVGFNLLNTSVTVAKCADPACKESTLTTVVQAFSATIGEHTSIAVGADGNPVISYYDTNTLALKVAKCNDPACTGAATITTVDDPANDVGNYNSIAVGADGNPVISHYDATGGDLKVTKCNDPACDDDVNGAETNTTVGDEADFVGKYTSITIGTNGNPVVSYYDETVESLKVAACNDPACTDADETITTLDDPTSGNLVGTHTSIAVGSDGDPVVGYYDATADALKVAMCNDPACSEPASIVTVDDPANDVGQYTSIAIGIDRNPVISYYDGTTGALKVARVSH